MLLTPLILGQEVIDGVTYTTIAPTGAYDGTPMNLELFWGGDYTEAGFIADRYYGYDYNLGLGNFSVDLGTNPNIKVAGTPGNDIVRNNSGNGVGIALELTAYGHGGNDEFYGGQEYDKLIGGPGTDKLFGGAGDDVLYGGLASDNDELTGGTGEDRFYIRSTDVNKELGVGTVLDKHKLDSRVHLVDTTMPVTSGGIGYQPRTWSDTDFEEIDTPFQHMHDVTGSERLMQSYTGGDIYEYRLGLTTTGLAFNGGWSDGYDSDWYPIGDIGDSDNRDGFLKPTLIVHEILHHYDDSNENQFITDFLKISKWTTTRPETFISFADWISQFPTGGYTGFVQSESKSNDWFNPTGLSSTALFQRDYGGHTPREDFCVTGEFWYKKDVLNENVAVNQSKQDNLQQLFGYLKKPTTPSDLTINQSVNINRPTFNWESRVADEFHVQIKDASNNVIREAWTAELTFPLTADLPAGKYTFLVSSMTIEAEESEGQESLMASLNFTVNHAPEWAAGVQPPAMAGQNEDHLLANGTTVLSLTAAASDVDASAKKGIAVFYTTGLESGSWQFTTNGGVEWNTFASVGFPRGRNNALLLPANATLSRVRFVPNKDYNGSVQLGYYAWDQTQGTAGGNFDISTPIKRGGITAFSTGTHVSTLTVSPVNDAPVWAAGPAAALIGINEDNVISSGTNISSLTSGMTDVDAGAKKGIAVFYTTGLDSGSWQFTTNGGVKWNTFASVGFPRARNNALLLPANGDLSRVRFVPNKDYNGSVQLGYYAWDQTQGTAGGSFDISTTIKRGGITAFSTGTHVSTLTVSPVNDAPAWVAGTPAAAMIGINEDNFISSGTTIASLTSGMTDVDAGAKKGIAVYYTSGLESGMWQFTTDGGAKWSTFASDGFPRGRTNAMLLPANGTLSRVRFVPNQNVNGSVQLGYYAWDQTQGTAGGTFNIATNDKLGGTTAFSTGSHVSTLTVTPVNDAPVWATGVQPPPMAGQKEGENAYGTTVVSLTVAASDVDAGAKKGIAIFSAPSAAGAWQFTINGGSTWSTLPVTSRSNARLLPANGTLSRVRFVPNQNANGSVQLGYYAWDQTQGTAGGIFNIATNDKLGGITAFSTGSHFSTLTVTPVNDAPVLLLWDGSTAYAANASPVVIDSNAAVADPDSANFNTGTLTIQVTTNVEIAFDRLGIKHVGNAANQIGVSGTTVSFGGVAIGTFTAGPRLTVMLNANANVAAISALMKAITYHSISEKPAILPRTITAMLTDGDGGTSAVVSKTVTVTRTNEAPVITGFDTAISYTVGALPVLLDTNAAVTDVDSFDFNTGKLTIEFLPNPGNSLHDLLRIKHTGTATGQIGVAGNTVSYSGVPIGTFAGGYEGFKSFVITLNAAANKVSVDKLLRALTFSNFTTTSSARRTIRLTLTDGDGGISAGVTKTIDVTGRG